MFCKYQVSSSPQDEADGPAFNSTATLHHVTPLPAGTTFESALTTLHNHDMLMRLDPELSSYEELPKADEAPNAKRYRVTDHMHTLPKGLWDTTVTFESQITNTDDGVAWVIKAPLGLVQTTTWRVVRREDVGKGKGKAEDDGGDAKDEKSEWYLVEDAEIKASKLLVGTVKGKCEENWRGVHQKFIGHLQGAPAAVKA
ncbi:hypothetical protein P280DRAFT_472329 [Massarina eburnea CBS 473.64]|uniref:DUF7053 domain-containing protein n=1 Tax=Massarina eburnea CBS 473.64 TaxID=1395130 RepID=A0A6A6RSC4_9PLEO|nr:hypothetical protein P280DRAFT_472329 [Massarina eburnea CBS 473.64]